MSNFPTVTHINLISRTQSGTLTTPKLISIDEFNSMSNQEPIKWREDVTLDPEYKDQLPDLSTLHFPSKSRSYLAKIQEAIAKTIPHLALIYANDAYGYSTITTKRFAAGELCVLYPGQYFPTKNTGDVYTIGVMDRQEKLSGVVDAKYHRGYGSFMASAPTRRKEHPDIFSFEDYDFNSVDPKTLVYNNMHRSKNFSFNNIPYVAFSNPFPIEPFTLVAFDYGTHYFKRQDLIPMLAHANGILLDSSLYISNNIDFAFIQGEKTVSCLIPRNAMNQLPSLKQGLKINVTKDIIYFISPEVLESLLKKYPPHSPFIRIEQDQFKIMSPA